MDQAHPLPDGQIIQGDCVEVMARLPAGAADLIFADPPYNLQLQRELLRPNRTRVDAVDDSWDQFADFAAYDAFTRAWLTQARRVLSDSGTIWVIGSYHNIHRVGAILQDLGYWILGETLWIKSNPMPNFRGVRFTNAHETLIWAKKAIDQRKYTFNYHTMKALNGGKQMRSDWTLALCTGRERLRVNGEKLHSTQKPEALLERVILASSAPGDLVLDPFFGTGTTGAVARRLGRRWLGIERETAYIEAARARIAAVQPLPEAEWPREPLAGRAAPRVALSALIAAGLLPVGALLCFDGDAQRTARVLAGGLLEAADGARGSIHQIGRRLSGEAAVNGWKRWHYRDAAGALQPIDRLRQHLRGAAG